MDLVEPVSAWGGGVLLWLVAFAVASFLLKEEAMARWLPRLYPLAAAVSLFFAYVDRLGEARRRRGLAGEVALTLLPYLPILLGLLDPEPVMVSVLGWQVKALTLFHIATLLPVVIGYFRTDPEAERDRTGHKQRANGRIARGAFGAAGVCVALSLLFFLLF